MGSKLYLEVDFSHVLLEMESDGLLRDLYSKVVFDIWCLSNFIDYNDWISLAFLKYASVNVYWLLALQIDQ